VTIRIVTTFETEFNDLAKKSCKEKDLVKLQALFLNIDTLLKMPRCQMVYPSSSVHSKSVLYIGGPKKLGHSPIAAK
jgi:hypothetical protein